MKIAAWFVVNNEMDYLPYTLDYHLSFLDSVYFLDTGSTDGTLEFLESKRSDRVIVEKYATSFTTQYELQWHEMSNPFPEVEVRNHAIARCKELLSPDWIVQIDGDEIFLKETRSVIECNPSKCSISCSTLTPVGRISRDKDHQFRAGHWLHDPHTRIWNTGYDIKYYKNPAMDGNQFHCIPGIKFSNVCVHPFGVPGNLFVPNNLHVHLHWMYGRKLEIFKNKLGVTDRKSMVDELNQFYSILPDSVKNQYLEWLKGKT